MLVRVVIDLRELLRESKVETQVEYRVNRGRLDKGEGVGQEDDHRASLLTPSRI